MSEDYQRGSLIAGYRLEALVGAGGMAVVWRARHQRLDKALALKVLRPALAEVPKARERFLAEARLASQVDYHPNIVQIYDVDEADGVPFIAMQLIHGDNLQRVLDREGRLGPYRALEFISPVASALDAAHAVDVVHRDIKPENILVDTQHRPEHVYLTDFGIAKATTSANITEPGNWMGTAAYMAPEQINAPTVNGRADQYSLACLAYRMLTGASPFPRDQQLSILLAHRIDPPPQLTVLRPDLPRAVDGVLLKAMAKAPEERYESCGIFADELREALGVVPDSPGRSAASGRPRRQVAPPQHADGSPAVPAMPSESDTQALTSSARADEVLRMLQAQPRPAPAKRRMTARRRQELWRKAGIGIAVATFAAAVAAIALALSVGTPGSVPASLVREGTFTGYPGQNGTPEVKSIAGAGSTTLAVGEAAGHAAIWRRVGSGAWKLVVNSPTVRQLAGALTGITYGAHEWIAVGNAGQGPVVVTSRDGTRWQLVGAATFRSSPPSLIDPYVNGVAFQHGDYVVAGTLANVGTRGRNRFATMWWSTDLSTWHEVGDTYTNAFKSKEKSTTLNGGQSKGSANAVTVTATGTFSVVGSASGQCAIWSPPASTQDWSDLWRYAKIPLPQSSDSDAVLQQATVYGDSTVAAGYAVLKNRKTEPIVEFVNDPGSAPIVLQAPAGLWTITGLTATSSGFTVAGALSQKGAQHAFTWFLPDSGHPQTTWPMIPPIARDAQEITALYTAANAVMGVAQQGQAEVAIELPPA